MIFRAKSKDMIIVVLGIFNTRLFASSLTKWNVPTH